jgi:hypothetical protein
VARDETKYPACGLYLTTTSLPGHEDRVPAGSLVMFHWHSEQGLPIVTLPRSIVNNRWVFYDRGYLIRDSEYVNTLSPRRTEGYYVLNRAIHVTAENVIPKQTLVQLSYSVQGTPILYVGLFRNNTIVFPAAGYKFSDQIFDFLDEAGFRAPSPEAERRLH